MAIVVAPVKMRQACLLLASVVAISFALRASVGQAERPVALNELQKQNERAGEARENPSDEEAAALEFVKLHHDELASLLAVLKQRNPAQYKSALRDLNRTRARLELVRSRSEDRYEVELETWKLKSRIQLLTARLQMNNSPALRKELLAAFTEQAKLRLRLLELERGRLAERIAKIDEQIERQGSDPTTSAEQQLKTLLNKLEETRQAQSKSNSPRETPKAKPTKDKETNPKSRVNS